MNEIKKEFCVYKHTNKENGKVYIGITCTEPHERWRCGFGYKDNQDFFEDIVKYGWDNFDHEILYSNLTEQEALKIEDELIIKHKSYKSNYGYNHKVSLKYPGLNLDKLDKEDAEFVIPYKWYKLSRIVNENAKNKMIVDYCGNLSDDLWFDQTSVNIMGVVHYYNQQNKPCTFTTKEFEIMLHTSNYTVEKAIRLLVFLGIVQKNVDHKESCGNGHLRMIRLNYKCIDDILNGDHWITKQDKF